MERWVHHSKKCHLPSKIEENIGEKNKNKKNRAWVHQHVKRLARGEDDSRVCQLWSPEPQSRRLLNQSLCCVTLLNYWILVVGLVVSGIMLSEPNKRMWLNGCITMKGVIFLTIIGSPHMIYSDAAHTWTLFKRHVRKFVKIDLCCLLPECDVLGCNENLVAVAGGEWRLKYERAIREIEFTKKRLQQEFDDKLEVEQQNKRQLDRKVSGESQRREEDRVTEWLHSAHKRYR